MGWSRQVEVEPGWEALLAVGAATGKAQKRRLAGTLRGRRSKRGEWVGEAGTDPVPQGHGEGSRSY